MMLYNVCCRDGVWISFLSEHDLKNYFSIRSSSGEIRAFLDMILIVWTYTHKITHSNTQNLSISQKTHTHTHTYININVHTHTHRKR